MASADMAEDAGIWPFSDLARCRNLSLQCGEADIASEPKQSTSPLAALWIVSLHSLRRVRQRRVKCLACTRVNSSYAISLPENRRNPSPSETLSRWQA